MILEAKHNFFLYPFFQKYALLKIKSNFHEVIINTNVDDKGRPVLAISNHVSWWDGFWVELVNLKLFKKKFFFMMLEEQLRKFWFFNYVGGYSVTKKSKSIIESINYTRNVLSDNKNFVLIFPQGKIQSVYNQSISFEKGIERIIEGLENQIQIVFIANLVDYFSNPKPSLFIYLDEYKSDSFSFDEIQIAYSNFFSKCIDSQKQISTEP
ncbi:MAG: 1-acyl-sn-glycerol-3-phosphate acyltransferase [Candidatus Cloacimonetes bacterium]|nr:1-acyl-sn-glycerol-3-phosphate acyltransferase [Candidatus Cloacimonadota bacterium]